MTQWAFVGQRRFFCFPELINKGIRKFCVHRVLFSPWNQCVCFNSLCADFGTLFKSAHLLDLKTLVDPIFTFQGRVERRTVATFCPLALAVPGEKNPEMGPEEGCRCTLLKVWPSRIDSVTTRSNNYDGIISLHSAKIAHRAVWQCTLASTIFLYKSCCICLLLQMTLWLISETDNLL